MEIAQLKTLIHVAELGSVSRAADRLGIGQPALSRQIRALERELGAPLFTRHGRGVALTELGRQLLTPAGKILETIDGIRQLADEGQTSFVGKVRFGMTPTVAEIVTVPLARRIKRAHPRLTLCLTSGFSGHILDWLMRDLLDACISYEAEATGAVRTQPILVEKLLLVGSAARGLRMEQPVPFSMLQHEAIILPSPLHGLRTIIDECAARAAIRLSPCLEADSLTGMIDLVRDGFGSTILPLAPIYDRVAAGQLTVASLVDPEPSRRVVLTYPTDRPVSAATRYTGATFAAIARDLIERGVWTGRMLTEHGH